MPTDTKRMVGPAIYAVDPWAPGNDPQRARHQLLSDDERAELAKVASIVRFKKGEQICNEGDTADAVFNVVSGIVASYRTLANSEHVASFLYPGDLFGLSEEGRYTNGTRAATRQASVEKSKAQESPFGGKSRV